VEGGKEKIEGFLVNVSARRDVHRGRHMGRVKERKYQ